MEGVVLSPAGPCLIDPAFWRNKRILLTGHTGFKGAWLALWLHRMGAVVHAIALNPDTDPSLFELAGVEADVHGQFGDLRNMRAVEEAMRRAEPEIVLHLAARALVKQSLADPIDAFSTNVMGTANLLEAIRGCDCVSTVIVVTSDKVYANDESGRAFDETNSLGGKDPYSGSKAATELAVRVWRESYLKGAGVRVVTARGGNVIGGGDYSANRIVPDIVRAVSRGEAPVLRSPESTRPWQHALDCLAGYLLYGQALARGEEAPQSLNFGPEPTKPVTVATLTREMLAAFQAPAEFRCEPDRGSVEMRSLAVDSTLARRTLGWRDLLPGQQAIEWTAEWHRRVFSGEDVRSVTLGQIDAYMSACR
jgi:CDP-glucose 4,6-dehydratase